MISDVLSDAVGELDRYLGDPAFADSYRGKMRAKILAVRKEMDAVRAELDTPPSASGGQNGTVMVSAARSAFCSLLNLVWTSQPHDFEADSDKIGCIAQLFSSYPELELELKHLRDIQCALICLYSVIDTQRHRDNANQRPGKTPGSSATPRSK